uniref:EF-hand domain-containing protein n=1 Tax=Astatotilapia calliptera TaxID=8154 RepID=A0AAX7SSR3_ASTCA
MDDGHEQDQYEERLKEVFNSFDTSGCGSLCPEELSDLCQSLHLNDTAPALLQTLLQSQDRLTARVDFEQFKDALILVLSSSIEPPQEEQESPEIKPKFVKSGKRYGRRSTPELIEPISDLTETTHVKPADEEDLEDNYDSAVPRKREEYEAEGQMHLWNPDEPNTPRGSIVPLSAHLEERLREACEEMEIQWDGCVLIKKSCVFIFFLFKYIYQVNGDALLSLSADGMMTVQEFVSRVANHNKPPTPSASTPYRQLKRHHSTQPFDEGGRRIATPSSLTSTIGMRLFSSLDDGTGYTPVEYILDAWIEGGIENSTDILQALNFELDGKLSLGDLTMALENELLVTKNGIHQAALASFKAEIRYLLERVDRELREKEKIRSDLEKAEKQKTQLANEVDEHHSAIEHMNNLNLRKLEQDHKEKLAAVKSELMREMEQIQQQAFLQRDELEAEIEKIREDESFIRDHLSISVKENRRLEMELLDCNEKLVDAQNQITKLQTSLDNIMKDKFGDLDPNSADFLLQEERIKQLRSGYEAQCRELQDRIDELQSELREFHSLGRTHQSCQKPLSEELESKSPGMESDPGKPIVKDIEISFNLRIKEVEDRFSCDQEFVAQRFQADVLKLEQHYQRELEALSESHAKQKLEWEAEMQKALERAEEQRKMMEEAAEGERQRLNQEWTKERRELESVHEEQMEALMNEKKQLQHELDDLISKAQTKEIELSKQLNDLHNRLQESLKTKHDLLVQTELLLNETVDDFKQEREELLSSNSELESKYNEMLCISERQTAERIELLNERDDLKMKIEELEMLLKRAAVDFELDRCELQESVSILEQKLKDAVEIKAEDFKVRVKELGMEIQQLSSSVEKVEDKEMKELKGMNTLMEEMLHNRECVTLFCEETPEILDEQDSDEETLTGTLYAGEEATENVDVFDANNEDGSATSDIRGDGELMGASENQELRQNIVQEDMKETRELCPANADGFQGCGDDIYVTDFPEQAELYHAGCELAPSDHPESESTENPNEAVFPEMKCGPVSSLEAFEDGENKATLELCKENNPQDVAAVGFESYSQEDEQHHETVVVSSALEETGYPGEPCLDAEVNCLLNNSLDSDCEHLLAELKGGNVKCGHECVDQDSDCERQPLLKLQAFYNTTTEENILLHEKISLLQQKTEILENLLAHNNEKIKAGHQVLEENYSLKVRMLLLMEHVKELEIKALKMTDLQIRYEDCMCENAKLKEQNGELERRVWSLESRINIFHSFKEQQISLVDEINRMREENTKLSELFSELERQDGILSAFGLDAERLESPSVEAFLDLDRELEANVDAVTDLEDCCKALEKQNTQLHRTITELQDKSQTLNEVTQTMEETLQTVNHQSTRLKSDLRVSQQERDSLKHEVALLHKQLQNAVDKNRILEMALHSSGLQNHSKKLYRDEMSRLMEQEQQLLRQENERLQAEVCSIKGDLTQSREKVRQLDATILSLKQHKHQSPSSLMKALEQENFFLKKELEAQRELTMGCEGGQRRTELESLQQENEALKAQLARLTTQLLEVLQLFFFF